MQQLQLLCAAACCCSKGQVKQVQSLAAAHAVLCCFSIGRCGALLQSWRVVFWHACMHATAMRVPGQQALILSCCFAGSLDFVTLAAAAALLCSASNSYLTSQAL